MSPREFDGATATEVHEHFDVDGHLTGYTRITTESLWDDESRDRALRLFDYEAGKCGCGCGLQARVAHDKNTAFTVSQVKCAARRAIKKVERAEYARAEATNRPDGWDDGLFFVVTDHETHQPPEPRKRGSRG